MIKISNLTKKYQNKIALDNVSCEIKSGGVVGFLGPNGAGKTTLMRTITGFISPSDGQVSVAGRNVQTDSLWVKSKIGYLPENNPLYLDMSVKNYLRFISGLHGLNAGKFNERLTSVARVCGITEILNRTIGNLSKGLKQRVGLAQTMLHNPDILILDEPTSGLDPNQIIEIRELIKHWGKKKTIILSTHILPEVEAICDRVVILNKGKIVAQGSTKELLQGGGKNQVINIKLKARADLVKEVLNKSDNIEEIKFLPVSESGVASLRLTIKPETDLRERLFRVCASKDWPILEMTAKELRLEEVFRELTKE